MEILALAVVIRCIYLSPASPGTFCDRSEVTLTHVQVSNLSFENIVPSYTPDYPKPKCIHSVSKSSSICTKQVRLADQARYHHALTVSSLGSDCQACTAPLLYTTCSIKRYPWQQELHTHTHPFPMGRGSFAFSIMVRLSSWNRITARLWSLSLNLQRRKIRQQLRKQVLRLALFDKQLSNSIYQLSHMLLTLSDLCFAHCPAVAVESSGHSPLLACAHVTPTSIAALRTECT